MQALAVYICMSFSSFLGTLHFLFILEDGDTEEINPLHSRKQVKRQFSKLLLRLFDGDFLYRIFYELHLLNWIK